METRAWALCGGGDCCHQRADCCARDRKNYNTTTKTEVSGHHGEPIEGQLKSLKHHRTMVLRNLKEDFQIDLDRAERYQSL